MLKRFLAYYKPHKKLFCMDMSASLIVAMLGIVYPIVTRRMLNDLIPNRQYQSIVLSGLLLLVIYLIRMGLNYFIQYQGHMMGVKMQAQMRRDMFDHLEKLPFSGKKEILVCIAGEAEETPLEARSFSKPRTHFPWSPV